MGYEDQYEKIKPGDVALIGFPTDENSTFMHGASLAPPRIRKALHSKASNLWTETGVNLEDNPRFHDLGDVVLGKGKTAFKQIRGSVRSVLERHGRTLSIGGDHSVTYPILTAYSQKYPSLNILQLDAHPDLYHEYKDKLYTHASPFARIMEQKLAKKLVQIGVRTFNQHQRQQAKRFGVETIEMREWHPDLTLVFDGPVYLSVDMDVLDPAYAPGVSHHEPGGLSTRDVIRLVQELNVPIIGADIVEYNPDRDWQNMTAAAGAKLLKEIAAKMLLSIQE